MIQKGDLVKISIKAAKRLNIKDISKLPVFDVGIVIDKIPDKDGTVPLLSILWQKQQPNKITNNIPIDLVELVTESNED